MAFKLPPVTLLVAEINPDVRILPAVALPTALRLVPASILPEATTAAALRNPLLTFKLPSDLLKVNPPLAPNEPLSLN